MSFSDILLFIIIVKVVHFFGTWKLYQSAGRKWWEAAIPIYNAIILFKIINRPWWWVFLMFIPIVNLIMFPVIWVETARSFGKNSTTDTILELVTFGFYTYYINYFTEHTYVENRSLKAKSKAGDFVSSILFAVVAATIVHTYIMQPFTIPTSSLEKTLLVGDFLFVSKFHYGARLPQTAVSFPMVHDTIPVLGTKSYTKSPQLPYMRLPGFQNIHRNDIVVFNWPVDTVRMFRDRSGRHYDKPVDKKSNYVKRAVGVAGDSLEIKDGKIFVNNSPLQLPDRAKPQYSYLVQGKGQGFNMRSLVEIYGITDGLQWVDRDQDLYQVNAITEQNLEKFKNHPNVKSVERIISPVGSPSAGIFPNNGKVSWNRDNFGPIYIPKAGATVKLNLKSFSLYRRIIEVYEGSEMGIKNKLEVKGNQVYLNGNVITEYTFKQDYYWMMGDNRHNSEDSRYWGYVPQNHIVGKPVFVWMSLDGNASNLADKIRWERLFTTVGGEGKPTSYFVYFLIGLVLIIGYNYFIKKKK